MDMQYRCFDSKSAAEGITWERVEMTDDTASPLEYLFQEPEYQAEDAARLKGFQDGDWWFIGIQARATITVAIGQGSFAVYELTSPGLWATESDSSEAHKAEAYEDEKASLMNAMKAIGRLADAT